MPSDTIKVEIVTAERVVFSADVDVLIVPGVQGELGILPHHVQLMTLLQPGEVRVKQHGQEEVSMAISGGFLEVKPDRVIILAEAAERDTEIDLARAEEAKRRAEERLAHRTPDIDVDRAEASLRRSMVRLKVASKRRQKAIGH